MSTVTDAQAALYDAECALHAAHQTRDDAWIAKAGDRLHDATVDYYAALAAEQEFYEWADATMLQFAGADRVDELHAPRMNR
jgi:hypothetical protein